MKKRIVAAVVVAALIPGTVAAAQTQVQKYGHLNTTEKLVEDWQSHQEELYLDSLELLALMVEAEAGDQPIEGKKLVVDVVLNRIDSPDFPNSIEEVITQKYAFTSYWDGSIDRVWEPAATTYQAIEEELENRTNYEVLYFTAEEYGKYGTHWGKVGDHYFSKK